jgi:hypothetical protein
MPRRQPGPHGARVHEAQGMRTPPRKEHNTMQSANLAGTAPAIWQKLLDPYSCMACIPKHSHRACSYRGCTVAMYLHQHCLERIGGACACRCAANQTFQLCRWCQCGQNNLQGHSTTAGGALVPAGGAPLSVQPQGLPMCPGCSVVSAQC